MPRRVAPRPYGKARPEGPSRRATVFMLRPTGPKVEVRRAEAKFWVLLICWATVASQAEERAKNWRRVQCVAEKAIKRNVEARCAEDLRKGEARRAEPTCHSVYAEARKAEGRGPKGRGEIFGCG